MKEKMTHLEAAKKVLNSAGRPLHYEQIVKIARAEGLISSNSPNLYISFGSILSREVRLNPRGQLKKVKPGVYATKDKS